MNTKSKNTEIEQCTIPSVMQCFSLDNFIYYKNKKVQIKAITKDVISVSGFDNNRYTPIQTSDNYISFIPLSDEVLKNHNFIKTDYGHDTFTWHLNDLTVTDRPTEIYKNGYYKGTNLKERHYYLDNDREIKYLHELQNVALFYYGFYINIA